MKVNALIIFFLLGVWSDTVLAQVSLSESRVTLHNEAAINSNALEYSPSFYKEGIVFVTTRHESFYSNVSDTRIQKNIMTLYQAERDTSGRLKKPQLLSAELLERVHEGPVTFNRTGEKLLFTRNVLEKKEKAKDGLRKLMIYEADKVGDEWKKPVLLPFNNKEFNSMHPTTGESDDVIYFTSDRPEGFGGMDLYVVKRVGEEWGEPENLGEEINTSGDEAFPFYHLDGTLYFSSNSHGSTGGLDIYMTTKVGDSWATPENLQQPFNTESDDFGFIVDIDNRNGYFSSNRKGGSGNDDIYSFEIFGEAGTLAQRKQKLEEKEIKITDENGNPIPNSKISVFNLEEVLLGQTADGSKNIRLVPNGKNGEFTLQVGGEQKVLSADENGVTLVNIDKNGNYVIQLDADGYLSKQVIVAPNADWSTLDFSLRTGADCVVLKGIVRVSGKTVGQGNAQVIIKDVATDEEKVIYTDANGHYNYCVECNHIYTIHAVQQNVFSESQIVRTTGDACAIGTVSQNFILPVAPVLLAEGQVIELPNIYFNYDDAGIRPDAEIDLNFVLSLMNENPNMLIELASHTDSRGSQIYNLNLSQRRSDSVQAWLVQHGVDKSRMAAIGYGEAHIRNGCVDSVPCVEAEHQENRRTEFKILSMNSPLLGENQSKPIPAPIEIEAKNIQINISPTQNAANAYRVISVKKEGTQKPYVVLAGTFRVHENAMKRMSQLQGLNYINAKITESNDGKYVVEAEEYISQEEAKYHATRLEKSGIGTYVKEYK